MLEPVMVEPVMVEPVMVEFAMIAPCVAATGELIKGRQPITGTKARSR